MVGNGAESGFAGLRRAWLGTILCAAAIAVAGIAVYWNSLDGQFMFDDQGWIVDNSSIRHLWPPSEWLFPADAAHVGGRPTVSFTLALNYAIGGLDVRGYHVVNMAIHILAALMLFGVARKTLLLSFRRSSLSSNFRPPTSDLPATGLAFAIALIWVVHPLNTEAVSYVIQRAESLVSLFYLLTFYAVIRGATASNGSTLDGSQDPSPQHSSRRWYFAAVAFCFLGMATKEVMVTAPIVILLYDAIFLAGSFRRALIERGGLYLAMAASWGVLIWTLATTSFHAETTGVGVKGFTPLSYLCTEPAVILRYLRLAAWPDSLCFAYDLAPESSMKQIVLPGLVIVALLALVVWALVKRPAIGFLGAAFFLILAPTSSFVPILDAAFEHRMYLALAPLIALAVVACFWLWRQFVVRSQSQADRTSLSLWTLAPALAGIVAGLAMVTIARNREYATELAIWRDTVSKRPENWRAHYNLGHALSSERRSAEAIEQYRKTLELDPNYARALQNLGAELALQGKLDEAIPMIERAIASDPDYAEAHFNLAMALAAKGQVDAAIRHYRAATRIKPRYAEAHNNLGKLYLLEGNRQAARAELEEAIRINPDFTKSHTALASLLFQEGDLEGAASHARRAIQLDPQAADAHAVLAAVLAGLGQYDAAVAGYERSLAIEPNSADTHFNLGLAFEAAGKPAAAIDQWREAVRLGPNRPTILIKLAEALATNPNDALRDAQAALELSKRANELTHGSNPLVLATRAEAEAEAGRYPQAVDFAEEAISAAGTLSNQEAFIAAVRGQLKLYESGRPYRAAPNR
jgi:tetratricopeptide (TPR) repeat protein